MHFFQNAKVAVKLSIFAVVSLLSLLLLATVGYLALNQQSQAMQEIYQEEFSAVVGVTGVSDQLLAANAHIYKVVNMINLEKSEAEIDQEIDRFMEMLEQGKSELLNLGALEQTALDAARGDYSAVVKAIEARQGVVELLKSGLTSESTVLEDEQLGKQLSELIYLAIVRYQLAITDVMPTVKMMKDIGAEMAAGMMAGTEEDFQFIRQAIKALNAFEQYHAKLAYQHSLVEESAAINKFIVIGVLAGILVAGLTALIVRSISRPLVQAASALEQMSRGQLGQNLDLQRRDEIGLLSDAFNRMSTGLQQKVSLASSIAAGDLTVAVELASDQDELGLALQQMLDSLSGMVHNISQATAQISSGSMDVAGNSQALSQGATESAASLEEVSASLAQMGRQVQQNAENAGKAAVLTDQASGAAERGNRQMRSMVAAMGDISDSAQNINKIIKVIDEIAFQTNLLALNAAVEAARAGQHGKGFAVVAEEVRNLAARSAKAAQETASLIEGSVEKTRRGSEIAEITAQALEEIVAGITEATGLVTEIAAASQEQAEGIGQVTEGLSQIDQVVQQNTANSEEGAAAAEQLSAQAEHLKQLIGRFQIAHTQLSHQQIAC